MSMVMITFDMETLPTKDATLIDKFRASIRPPGTIKKSESIAAWHAENGAEALDKIVRDTSFSGLYGHTACISWALDDDEPLASSPHDSEADAIMAFYSAIENESRFGGGNIVFCGHNIVNFDMTFLRHRSIILGIKPPPIMLKAMHAKPWDNCIADTKLMWTSDKFGDSSMDKLCYALGVGGKGGFDGSMVADTWPVDPAKVIDYCKDDVRRTRAIYKRISFL